MTQRAMRQQDRQNHVNKEAWESPLGWGGKGEGHHDYQGKERYHQRKERERLVDLREFKDIKIVTEEREL